MDRLFRLSLGIWPGAQLSLLAESATFFVGDVPGLTEAPPDYTDLDRATLGHKVAGWNSSFKPISAVFLDPAPTSHRGLGGA